MPLPDHPPIPLRDARRLADGILDILQPYVVRIEIAGSIRRRRAVCGDLDFVIEADPQIRGALLSRIKEKCQVKTGDSPTAQNTIAQLATGKYVGCQLDFFFARPEFRDLVETRPSNFGTLFLCRTGSKAHNIWIAEVAKARGTPWDPYQGIQDAKGSIIACETETAIYDALELPFLEPVLQREDPKHGTRPVKSA